MEIIAEKPGFLIIKHIKEPNHLHFDWINGALKLEEFKKIFMEAYDVAKERNVKTYIADTSKLENVIFKECIDWTAQEYVPLLNKIGLKKIITVVPNTALSRLNKESWQKEVSTMVMGMEMLDTDSYENAKKLVV